MNISNESTYFAGHYRTYNAKESRICVCIFSFFMQVHVCMHVCTLFYVIERLLNRVQVVLSRFSMILFCFVQAKTLCRHGCMYFLAALVLMCVYVIVYM